MLSSGLRNLWQDLSASARQALSPRSNPPATNGLTRRKLLESILANVVGYDLNPLAVISARTNYLLALGDLLDEIEGEIDIPIYLADSILTPSAGEELDKQGKILFMTSVGEFALPRSLVKADYIDELANLLRQVADGKPIECWSRDESLHTFGFEQRAEPQDLGLMCVPFTMPDATARMRESLYYTWGDSDLF